MINKLNKWDLNCSVFNSYDFDDCLSLNELLCRFFTKINECIEVSNKSLSLLEWLHEVGLKQEVVTLLTEWKDNGTLAELISEQILTEIKQNIKNNKNAIEQLQLKDTTHDEKIQALETKDNDILGEIETLKFKDTELEGTISSLRGDIETNNGNIEEVKSELKTLSEQILNIVNEMKIKNGVDITFFGAKNDIDFDSTSSIIKAINYAKTNNYNTLFIPNGKYYVTQSLNTKGLYVVGVGTPEIPFMTWDYTRPSSDLNDFKKYFSLCQGSIIGSDYDGNIFSNGLNATNIGIIGNRRATNQNGVSQMNGGDLINLSNCRIHGCGKDGVNAIYGLIATIVDNRTWLYQNGRHGIYIGKESGGYTGETNFITIKDSFINRNEKDGIKINSLGRSIHIENVDLEQNGEPSDTQRQKGNDVYSIVYGCRINIDNDGANFTGGSIIFNNNYSEETFGLLYLETPTGKITNGVTINNNYWRPLNQNSYSCGVALKGWIENIEIMNNNLYGKDEVKILDNNVYAIKTSNKVSGGQSNACVWKQKADYNGSIVEISGTGKTEIYSFDNLITGSSFDESFTNININKSVIPYDLQYDGKRSPLYGLILSNANNQMVGIITDVSYTMGVIKVRGDVTRNIVNGKGTFYKTSGITIMSGDGSIKTIMVDWDGTVISV